MKDKKLSKRLRDLELEAKSVRAVLADMTPGGIGERNCKGRLQNILLDIRNVKNLLEMEDEQQTESAK